MKKYLLGLFAIAIAIGFSAFTQADSNVKSAFECQWFIYDNPGDGTGDDDDFPANFGQATNKANYRLAAPGDVDRICTEVTKICAICAFLDDDDSEKPELDSEDALSADIRTELSTYDFVNNTTVPDGNLVKEKPQP